MDTTLKQVIMKVYEPCNFEISGFTLEAESKEYAACQFVLSGRTIISRNAKITPKKVGQFVTFWKRNGNGPITPFNETDQIDFFIVNAKTENKLGQFIFPKSILIKKRILSTVDREGKRAFRVYPFWDVPDNKQAAHTQKWQLDYFFEINDSIDFYKVAELYKNK
ncbi:MepB family protein [Aequorivita sp. Q41]|uniref:MepB family protein n=1 Tax=Aequorivita sp. Q41 TaxID=3153300 RepID=UPI003241BFCD